MKKASPGILLLLFMMAMLLHRPVMAQEAVYQIVDFIKLPAELQIHPDSSCSIEFREQWIVDAANFSISKKTERYKVPCPNKIRDILPIDKASSHFDISYEFSFLDPHNESIAALQNEFVNMCKRRFPGPSHYDLPSQLLSVYFHEEWLIDPENQEIVKKVKGFTPVIWQQRKTVEGEPIDDAETGYPVYYTLKLERINLRNP